MAAIFSKLRWFASGEKPSFWMRNIGGRRARISGVDHPGTVHYTLDLSDEEHACSYEEWNRLPIWTGRVPDYSSTGSPAAFQSSMPPA